MDKLWDLHRYFRGWGAVAVGATVAIGLALVAGSAEAEGPGSSCVANNWGEGGMEAETSNNAMAQGGSNGTIAQMHVAATMYCQRISSLYMKDQTGPGLFEFGYVVGWETCNVPSWLAQPAMFEWTYDNTGFFWCEIYTGYSPSMGNYNQVRAADPERDYEWAGKLNGSDIASSHINLGYIGAYGFAAAERSNSQDSSYGRWVDVQEHHTDNGWTPWDNFRVATGYLLNNDPDYHFERETADSGKVVHD